ncbi:signal-induced proliferation-associated 1-like protein 3 isoform X1 [Brienomyrus brachyistius]|uniref:signal-induced proliferation-associated 1-like protein 3 isoform X1 n=1 Tax=Brienomyrus brachyistius TaxID=42636 RepID=UPI0020B20213|nr:signal-induced proliferation-associated 1-like protein 3 isoform X1 [Brienomyrus brachyistius]XP_048836423.1 signal-induced proliferation-associated 1-like protein 3 isoform X1 [Brienomyrus brachyistius]XP_048836424.1 signal-induced proliferation-associated 1-like protein 3 isoform X1 [Brienomyrus brachyistius]XP_048836425.1 signal-induced proliferation-associated 1-like protein 3 isoform X1 [Brienomyrus brachyistius]
MSSYRDRTHCAPELLEVEGGPPSFCSLPPSSQTPLSDFHMSNGHSPSEPSAPPRVCVPKMGVRARIAEWPPRRERSQESLLENGHGGQSGPPLGRGTVPRITRLQSKDVEFRDGIRGGSPRLFRPAAPLRQRSSSEVTLSEQDDAEAEVRAGLFREYGSTSSIDVQGVPEQSFFDMLSQFHQERPDQRSTAPAHLGELLRVENSAPNTAPSPALQAVSPTPRLDEGPLRVRKKSGGTESSLGTSSLFRKLRSSSRTEVETVRGDLDEGRPPEARRTWHCPKSFAHFDVQSMLFDLHEASSQRAHVAQRRNTATGASAASTVSPPAVEPGFSSTEDLLCPELAPPLGSEACDDTLAPLLLSCPHFCNETGGCSERNVSFLSSWAGVGPAGAGPAVGTRCANASVSVLEVPPDQQLSTRLERFKHYSIEHVDLGARYYRDYFHGREHSTYFGTDEKLGAVAVSIRREKLEDTKDLKDQYQYRLILRTNEMVTLRGSILEDAVPSTARHGTARGLPLKELLECVAPELSVSCLRLALNTPKVTEQLLKLDEQGLSQKQKVGILLCRAGQSTEEEMYNNEEATPAFRAFLDLLGEQVCLRGFTKYAAQLDTKTDSTGTHSLYTTYLDYEVMFHVSTMLPYMPNNPQQLLRKRHIGNDIVTIIFQEPGALPFTPQNIRSQFQHVFVIVRVHNPCTDDVSYSVAVTRMKDVPMFGPPIPNGVTFRNPEVFRDFLLAKVINAETAAHKSEKFHTMARRTRQEYLRDLVENCASGTFLDSAGKLNNLISLASKKRERARAREGAELGALGAVTWRVKAQDFSGGGAELACVLGMSGEYVVLVDCATKEVVFNCYCADVIGWTPERLALKIYYGRGDHIAARVAEGCAQDIREIVQRLKALTVGCETVDMTLRRNGLGQLGFHVRLDGTVAEVEEYGFAWQAGLRQGSRLVEICKVAAVTLSHEQMIDLLRTSVTVKVVIIPPYDEGGPRRGCTEEYEMKTVEQKAEPEPVAAVYRPSHRTPAWRWDSPPATHSAATPQRWTPVGPPQSLPRTHKVAVPIPYREVQHLPTKRPVSFPENHYNIPPTGGDRVLPYRNPSASFSAPSSTLATAGLGGPGLGGPFVRYKPSPDRYGMSQRPLLGYEPHMNLDMASSGESSSGFTSQGSTMERIKPEPLWHMPVSSRVPPVGGGGTQKRSSRQDPPGKDSPNRHSKGEAQYSSHSSSNTLSSNASSSHSEERWFDGGMGGSGGLGDPAEPDLDPLAKGGSSDSGIDASTLYTPSPGTKPVKPPRSHLSSQKPLHGSATYSGLQELASRSGDGRRRESSPALPASSSQSKNYRTRTFPPPGASADSFKPSRACYTPQGYKTPPADKSRPVRATTITPTLGTSQQLSSSVPKTSYSKSKHNAWQHHQSSATASTCTGSSSDSSNSKKQVDVNSKNVFGQPRLRASLRDLRSPRRSHKSTIEDDLKKLIIMDQPSEAPHRDASPRRSLQRTFSDESLCSGRRDSSFASATLFDTPTTQSDLLFTCTLPTRRHAHSSHVPSKKVPLSASELSLTEVRDKVPPLRRLDPGLMPLPDTACGLEWASLVNAAKAYEVQRAVSLFSLSEPPVGATDLRLAPSPIHFHTAQTPRTTPTFGRPPLPPGGDAEAAKLRSREGEAGQGGPAGRDGQPAGEQPAASGGVTVGQRAASQVQPDAHCRPGRQEVTSALRQASFHRPCVWH